VLIWNRKSLSNSANQVDARILQLQNQLDAFCNETATSSLNSDLRKLVNKLVDKSESALDLIRGERIKNSLWFHEINSRYRTIEEAHERTFNWVYGTDKDYEGELERGPCEPCKHMEEEKRHAQEKLIGWLSSEIGIFHIAGKFGSGKSTLMQYICVKAETRSFLQLWAGKSNSSPSSISYCWELTIHRRLSIGYGKALLLETWCQPSK
jgi:hypothetical protein